MTIPELIKKARTESGLTQQQLADSIEKGSRSYIALIEAGKQSLSEPKAREILAAMGYELSVEYKIKKTP